MLLNELRQLGRFAQMLVLLHVAEDVAQRVILGEPGIDLESDGLVLHLLDAPGVLGFRLRQEVCLEAATGRGVLPIQARRIHVHGDEEVATHLVGNASTIRKRDQRIRRARVGDSQTA